MRRHQATSLAGISRLCRFLLLSSVGAEASGRSQRSADEGARIVQVALGPAGVGDSEFNNAAGPQPQEGTASHRRRAAGAKRKTEEEDVAAVQRSGRTQRKEHLRRDSSGTSNGGQEVEQDENYEEQPVLIPSKADPVQSSSLSTGSKTVRSTDHDVRVGRNTTATKQSQTHSRGPASNSSAEVGVQIPWWPFASVWEVFRHLVHRRSPPATKSQLFQQHQLQAQTRRSSSSTTEQSFATLSANCGERDGTPNWSRSNLPYKVRLPCNDDPGTRSVEDYCRYEAVDFNQYPDCETSCADYMLNCLGLEPNDEVKEEALGWSNLYRDELYEDMCTDTCKSTLPDFGTNCPQGVTGSAINEGTYNADEIRVRSEVVFSYFWKIALQGRPRR
mmetsp:Transcript_19272/g.48208  ORF Transcript_19272/g.48208 Transcript_19272/m.48208 type:complete len:389 (+) Transcript_19272:118-1284(+)